MRYLRLYSQFFTLQFKSIIEYRTDFLIGLFSVVIGQINTFILTVMIFTQMDNLAGYTIYEIFLMYGFFVLVKGVDHFYNDNIWSFAWNKIKDGRFTEILLRPINPIFYIIMERIEINGLSEIIIGLIIVLYSMYLLKIHLSIINIFLLVIIILCGLVVFFSIKLLFSAPAFWTICCGEFMTAGVEISNSAKNPLTVYKNQIIKSVLLYIFPFPIAAYFPAIFCLNETSDFFGLMNRGISGIEIVLYSALMAGILLVLSISVWYKGLRKFEPTGT